jgi:hypothetical protein
LYAFVKVISRHTLVKENTFSKKINNTKADG